MRRFVAVVVLALLGCAPPQPPPKCAALPAEGSFCGDGTRWNQGVQKCEAIPMEACKPGLAWQKTACMPCPDNTHWAAGHCVANNTLARADKGGPKWVAGSSTDPPNMVFGGWDDDAGIDFYVCRGVHSNGTHPGRLAGKKCHIGYGGKEVVLTTYEVLTSLAEPQWDAVSSGGVPANAFVGGEEPTGKLVVCRVETGAMMLPGKVIGGTCHYGLNGVEGSSPVYEVAVFP
jgi:hypothetical protein